MMALSCGATAGQNMQAPNQRSLRIFVLKDSPFMSYRDENGVLTGFHVDLANLICGELNAQCEIKETLLANVVDEVSTGQGDIGIAALTVTSERWRKVLFSVPYIHGKTVWLSRTSMAQSRGSRVATVEGSTQYAWVAKKSESHAWSVVSVKVNADLVAALEAGRADAIVSPFPSAMNILKSKGFEKFGFRLDQIEDPEVSTPQSMAVNPKKPDLLDQLNTVLENIKANGKMDEINSKYFPFRIF